MEEQKSGTNRKTIIIIIAAAVALCIVCVTVFAVIFGSVWFATQPAVDQADAFMQAMKDADYPAAFELCAPDLKDELGSPQTLREMMTTSQLKIEKWSFNSRNVENKRADLLGTVTFTNGEVRDLDIVLLNVDETWMIAGFHFREQ
jgi:hypothetical protein